MMGYPRITSSEQWVMPWKKCLSSLPTTTSQKRTVPYDLHVQWGNVDWPSLVQHLGKLSQLQRAQESNSQVMLKTQCPLHSVPSSSDVLCNSIFHGIS